MADSATSPFDYRYNLRLKAKSIVYPLLGRPRIYRQQQNLPAATRIAQRAVSLDTNLKAMREK